MSHGRPVVQVGKKIKPLIKEFSFNGDKYLEGLESYDVPEQRVESLKIRLSAQPPRKLSTRLFDWSFDMNSRVAGNYDFARNIISLYPQNTQIQRSQELTPKGLEILEPYLALTRNMSSAVHGYVLTHETGHFINLNQNVGETARRHIQLQRTHGLLMRYTARAALFGAVAGSELSEITHLHPFESAAIGLVAGGIAVGAASTIIMMRTEGLIQPYSKAELEVPAELFEKDPTAISRFGDIIKIELKAA